MWEKLTTRGPSRGTVLFVHGSSMASTPTFDLFVPGWQNSSVTDWFAVRGFDTWCFDSRGYGRSAKPEGFNAYISEGVEDCIAAAEYVEQTRGNGPLFA